jgi:hypothetical protein
MKSNSESGMNTCIDHFNKLINGCKALGALYNPVPVNLQIPTLTIQLQDITIAVSAVDKAQAYCITAEGTRKETFSGFSILATRIQASAIVLGLQDAIIVRIKEIVRKIRGQRVRKIKIDPTTEEQAKHISVSQVSFNEQIEHLNQLIELLKSQPAYTPAEVDLSIAALDVLLDTMRTTNTNVIEAEVSLANARQERNRLLYAPKTGMIDTAFAVKEYVKAVFGSSSQQYKDINHITFKGKKIQ